MGLLQLSVRAGELITGSCPIPQFASISKLSAKGSSAAVSVAPRGTTETRPGPPCGLEGHP